MALSEKARFVADYVLQFRRSGPATLHEMCADACRAWELIQAIDKDTNAVTPLTGDIKWRHMSELPAKRAPTRYILVWGKDGPDVWSSATLEIKESMLGWAEIQKPEGIE